MVTLERYKAAVQRLWTGKATITVREGVLNEANGRTEPVERVLVEGAVGEVTGHCCVCCRIRSKISLRILCKSRILLL